MALERDEEVLVDWPLQAVRRRSERVDGSHERDLGVPDHPGKVLGLRDAALDRRDRIAWGKGHSLALEMRCKGKTSTSTPAE